MQKRRWKLPLLAGLLVLSLIYCTRPNTPKGSSNQNTLSFDEFKSKVYKEPGAYGVYIVDGDMPIRNDQELKRYYDYIMKNTRLTVYNSPYEPKDPSGLDSDVIWKEYMRDGENRIKLTYCISDEFDTSFGAGTKTQVRNAMIEAAEAWYNTANVHFVEVTVATGTCTPNNFDINNMDQIIFDVSPAAGGGQTRAFFPNSYRRLSEIPNTNYEGTTLSEADKIQEVKDLRNYRRLLIAEGAFYHDTISLKGLIMHELGHILGFRHEHMNAKDAITGDPLCPEIDGDRQLYDGSEGPDKTSVMYFRNTLCGWEPPTTGTPEEIKAKYDYYISDKDIAGARKIYGPDIVKPDITFVLDSEHPERDYILPQDAQTLNISDTDGRPNFMRVEVYDPLSSDKITAEHADTANLGITKVEFYINGELKYTDTEATYKQDKQYYECQVDSTLYPDGQEITVTVKAYDNAGNITNSDDAYSTFRARIANNLPTVLSHIPDANKMDIGVDGLIQVKFSEPMDGATIDTNSFLVNDGTGNISGTVNYDASTRIATFSPAVNLQSSHDYSVTITAAVKDSSGVAMAGDFSWQFTTQGYSYRLGTTGFFTLGTSHLHPLLPDQKTLNDPRS